MTLVLGKIYQVRSHTATPHEREGARGALIALNPQTEEALKHAPHAPALEFGPKDRAHIDARDLVEA